MTEQDKFDGIFNEPLSNRSKKPDLNYKPPQKMKRETWEEYFDRVVEYDEGYEKK